MAAAAAAPPSSATATKTWNTFPEGKSRNLKFAPEPIFYSGSKGGRKMEEVEGYVPILQLEDPHAVIMASGKGGETYIAGKTMECGDYCSGSQSATSTDSFAMRMDAGGLPVWGWRSNFPKKDAANGIAVLPSGDVLVAGYRQVKGIGVRSITKLNSHDGREIWTMNNFGDGIGKYAGTFDQESKKYYGLHGAIELITIEGDYVVVSGYTRGGGPLNDPGELHFKSYGNSGGKSWICKLAVADLEKKVAFTTKDIIWGRDMDDYDNAKAGYIVPQNGHIAVLLWSEAKSESGTHNKNDGKTCGLRMLDVNGHTLWTENYGYASKLEGTDLAISKDGKMIGITGHGAFLSLGKYYSGKILTVDISSSSPHKDPTHRLLKTTEIVGGGDPELIYNECWGIQAAPGWEGGFVVSCGTGIETCETKRSSPAKDAQCKSGIGDPVHFPKLKAHGGQWMSLVAKVNSKNKLQWQRVDAYKSPTMKKYVHDQPWEASSSSASEFVVVNDDDSFSFLQDETFGFGILKLKKEVLLPPPPPTTTTTTTTTTTVTTKSNKEEEEGPLACAATCTAYPGTCTELNTITGPGGCAASCKPEVTAELRATLCKKSINIPLSNLRKN
jgi:hypothetical protein